MAGPVIPASVGSSSSSGSTSSTAGERAFERIRERELAKRIRAEGGQFNAASVRTNVEIMGERHITASATFNRCKASKVGRRALGALPFISERWATSSTYDKQVTAPYYEAPYVSAVNLDPDPDAPVLPTADPQELKKTYATQRNEEHEKELGYAPHDMQSVRDYLKQPGMKDRLLDGSDGHKFMVDNRSKTESYILFVPDGNINKAYAIIARDTSVDPLDFKAVSRGKAKLTDAELKRQARLYCVVANAMTGKWEEASKNFIPSIEKDLFIAKMHPGMTRKELEKELEKEPLRQQEFHAFKTKPENQERIKEAVKELMHTFVIAGDHIRVYHKGIDRGDVDVASILSGYKLDLEEKEQEQVDFIRNKKKLDKSEDLDRNPTKHGHPAVGGTEAKHRGSGSSGGDDSDDDLAQARRRLVQRLPQHVVVPAAHPAAPSPAAEDTGAGVGPPPSLDDLLPRQPRSLDDLT